MWLLLYGLLTLAVELNKLENRWKSIMYRIHLVLILKPSASIRIFCLPACSTSDFCCPSRRCVSESGAVVPGQPRVAGPAPCVHRASPWNLGLGAPGRCPQVRAGVQFDCPTCGEGGPSPERVWQCPRPSVPLPVTTSSRMGSCHV